MPLRIHDKNMSSSSSLEKGSNPGCDIASSVSANEGLAEIPFPWVQLSVLSICRIVEPIAFCSITTYSIKMVQDINGPSNAESLSGILISAFSGAEAATAWIWGSMSDKLGRKPCILVALAGTAGSCIMFGFSQKFWIALLARIIGGCLNGNTAVMQTMVTEIVKNPKHEHIAFAMQPFMWYVGAMAGSALGGFAAQPVDTWPALEGSTLDKFPYLLPNIISAAMIMIAMLIAWVFLKETKYGENDQNFEQPDYEDHTTTWQTVREYVQTQRLWLRTMFSGTTTMSRRSSADSTTPFLIDEPEEQKASAFTRPVLGWILVVALLSYHQMGFVSVLPIYLEEARTPGGLNHGGLGKSLPQFSVIALLQSIISIACQAVVYPLLGHSLGTWKSVFISFGLAPIPYLLIPFCNIMSNVDLGIYASITLQCLATTASYPLAMILLKDTCSDLEMLGKVNGVTMSVCSLARTIANPLVGLLYSRFGPAISWWSMAAVAMAGFFQLFFMNRPKHTN